MLALECNLVPGVLMQVQILLLILWLVTIAVRRVCDYLQGACLHLWVLIQGSSGAVHLNNELMGANQSREDFDRSLGNVRPLAEASVEA